jgi:hypothetical protein
MYLNVFIVYLNIFQCIYSIFMVYLNICIVYLNVFECTYSISVVYFNVSIICLNAFIVCFNVFIDIVIGILPSHFDCNVFAMHTHLHVFFHSRQSLPSQHAIPLHSFFTFPLICSNFHTIYPYCLHLYITPHSTFYIPSCHWLCGA